MSTFLNASNLFLLSKIFLCLAGFSAYRLHEIGPCLSTPHVGAFAEYVLVCNIYPGIQYVLN